MIAPFTLSADHIYHGLALRRVQLPVKLAFTISINEAQGAQDESLTRGL